MENIKGVLFDFGGTIDTNGIHWSEMIWMAYETNKIAVKKANYLKSYIYAERNLSTRNISETTTFYETLSCKLNLQLQFLHREKYSGNINIETEAKLLLDTCYEQVKSNINSKKDVLLYLKNKYVLGLVSNFYGNLNTVVNEFGLQGIFTEIIDSQIHGLRKPDPMLWQVALKLLDLQAEETVIVGDSYINDIAPAKYLDCKAIWLKGKSWNDQHQFEHFSADRIIYTLNELQEIL
ncbi:MAG: HAD family hydrolase [Bacteroidetes bacterium]|nr:HAD family hydrolase [Bacteroidota bacterium]